MSLFLKILSILWVGGVILVGLIINGDKLYSWIWKKFMNEVDWSVKKLDLMFIEISQKRFAFFYGFYLLLLFSFALFFLWPSILGGISFGILFTLLGWKIPRKLINVFHKRRTKKFVNQMVDGLTLMSNAMRSGLNVPQALQIVSDELPNPISQEFALVLSQNKLGISLEEALGNLSVRMPHDDIEMFTTSVNILKETGGNLAETFDTIAYTIRERIKVEAKISAMVAQGVMQGVVIVLMPFALALILYAIEPEKIRPMFTTVPGWILLSIMVTLQFIGGFLIWKIVSIKV